MYRTDIDVEKFSQDCNLYRGAGLTIKEIKDFEDAIKKEDHWGI